LDRGLLACGHLPDVGDLALKLFQLMMKKRMHLTSSNFNSLVRACKFIEDPSKLAPILDMIVRSDTVKSYQLHMTALELCSKLGSSKNAIKLIQSLIDVNHMKPPSTAYELALKACSLQQWEDALTLLASMREQEVPVTSEHVISAALVMPSERGAERLALLRRDGISETDLKKLRAPIGLDLGGKAPWEVAVAAVGEVIGLRASFETRS
jgi:hypothetical protein